MLKLQYLVVFAALVVACGDAVPSELTPEPEVPAAGFAGAPMDVAGGGAGVAATAGADEPVAGTAAGSASSTAGTDAAGSSAAGSSAIAAGSGGSSGEAGTSSNAGAGGSSAAGASGSAAGQGGTPAAGSGGAGGSSASSPRFCKLTDGYLAGQTVGCDTEYTKTVFSDWYLSWNLPPDTWDGETPWTGYGCGVVNEHPCQKGERCSFTQIGTGKVSYGTCL